MIRTAAATVTAAALGALLWAVWPPAPTAPPSSRAHDEGPRAARAPEPPPTTTAPTRRKPPILLASQAPAESPPRSPDDDVPTNDLLPELQGLWPQEIEARRRKAYVKVQTDQAAALGLPEAFRSRYVEIMEARRRAYTESSNKRELFELTPEEADALSDRADEEMRAQRAKLFAEAGVDVKFPAPFAGSGERREPPGGEGPPLETNER